GGTFNFSLPRGTFTVTATASDYSPTAFFLNATGDSVDLGTIRLDPYAWVAGRIAIDPWASLVATGFGAPGLGVVGWGYTLPPCGGPGYSATDGRFNVSVPYGATSELVVTGSAPRIFGSATGGYDASYLAIGVNQAYLDLSPGGQDVAIFAPIFGVVEGNLRD